MTRLVADASVIGNVLLTDEQGNDTGTLLDLVSTAELVEPAHWPIESCGLLLKAARRRRMSTVHRDGALAQAKGLIALAEVETSLRIGPVVDVALEYHISVYDAAYLELAARAGLPLLTSDAGLQAAAAKANVDTVSVI